MKATVPFVSCLLFCAIISPAEAQERGTASPLFTTAEFRRALSEVPVDAESQLDPRSDWSRVQRLAPSTEIVLSAGGTTAKTYRFVAADDTALTVLDPDDANRATLRIARADVSEIRRWTGRRGSIIGAAIGVAGGIVLGVGAAVNLAYRQCGRSCTDERFLIGLSIVGIPIAGGLAGYYGVGDRRRLTSIYVRP